MKNGLIITVTPGEERTTVRANRGERIAEIWIESDFICKITLRYLVDTFTEAFDREEKKGLVNGEPRKKK